MVLDRRLWACDGGMALTGEELQGASGAKAMGLYTYRYKVKVIELDTEASALTVC